MISGVHVEVVLTASYAIFLVGVAFVLELLARHSHKRSERYRNSGFVYFQQLDFWQMPGRPAIVARGNRLPALYCSLLRSRRRMQRMLSQE
jgi:hypothetical protein